ncbi:hypothetical protein [Comamonas sp. F1-6]|uniref:hypothetical protein n=1 Tax=Comamonas sp. F1-6 TaxID=673550 RepID=UPI0031D4D29E
MSTRFLTISKAVEAVLQEGGPVAGLVERNRSRVLASSVRTAVVVRQGQAKVDQVAGRVQAAPWLTSIQIDCYGRASVDQAADEVVDGLLQLVQQRLGLDLTLGGAAGGLALQGIAWDFDVDGDSTACATATYYARHSASAVDLT